MDNIANIRVRGCRTRLRDQRRQPRDADDPAQFNANAAPVVTPPANNTATEGTSKSFPLGSFTDAGPSPWAVDVDWGDGTAHTTFSLASAGTITAQNHTFADGPATRTVTVKVTDTGGTGSSGQATFTVAVSNVAPTISPTGAAHVNEGSPYSLTLGSVTDPGADTVSSYIVHWGDSNTDTYATNVGAKTHTYADGPATRTITVDLVDEDGTFLAAGTTSVIVDNVAPTTTFLSGDTTVDESDVTVHTYVFSIFDPGADTIIGTGTSCGVGGTPDGSVTSTNTSVTFSCKFLNGPADPQLQANATDSDVGTGPFTFQTVHVNNVAPAATNDTGTTNEDSNLVAAAPGVLGNDSDVAADSLLVAQINGSAANVGLQVTLASGAKVTLNADGSHVQPEWRVRVPRHRRVDHRLVHLQASDGTALSSNADGHDHDHRRQRPAGRRPTSASVGHHDAGVDVTLSATDVDGESLTFSIVTSPTHSVLGAIVA